MDATRCERSEAKIVRTTAQEIAADPQGFRQRYIEMRAGLLQAQPGEWLASVLPVTIYGTHDLPAEGEPVICFVLNNEGTKIGGPAVVQHIVATTWINCYDGTIFDLDHGERVVPISGVSRVTGGLQLHLYEEPE